MARRWKQEPAFQKELRNPVGDALYGRQVHGNTKGIVYDKKPFKVSVTKYHLYVWCGCGRSNCQPFCDGVTCQSTNLKRAISGGPVKYVAPEDRDVWFCNCKQTNRPPFCDGSHRAPDIQSMRIDGKPDLWDPSTVATVEAKGKGSGKAELTEEELRQLEEELFSTTAASETKDPAAKK